MRKKSRLKRAEGILPFTLEEVEGVSPITSFAGLPLTVEVFLHETSFWLTHTVLVEGARDLVPERGLAARSLSRRQLHLPTDPQ